MKIAGAIIRNNKIKVNTENEFYAFYKGRSIYVTTNHGFGEPKCKNLKRFNIEVIHLESGMYDNDTWEDHHDIKDAINSALKGAALLWRGEGVKNKDEENY